MKKDWIVVLDGAKAKILKPRDHSLVHVFPTYHAHEMITPVDKDSRRLRRVFESHEVLRHAYSPSEDYKDSEKKEFITKISDIIHDNLNEYDGLIIIAPPERLGEIRAHLTHAVKEKITREIGKDLVKTPLKEIYQYAMGLATNNKPRSYTFVANN